ncbi:hypothetical protein C8N35_108120 [Breoghania corrubedonensis]|uniref:Uncharacterized protein n=2 Tax=Breoghania corrubedonensis TaxID=665038 RepID=A0A2T5V5R6_9HYPH|nr:hypothetical protein C8N35_108120 [Breoghania corrubedonensis]
MSLRLPQRFAKICDLDPVEQALEYEVLAEKASTLGRLQGKLERALVRLAEFEQAGGGAAERRERLVEEAGEALWYVAIQRDLCGLRVDAVFYRTFQVPRAVINRMGPARRGAP